MFCTQGICYTIHASHHFQFQQEKDQDRYISGHDEGTVQYLHGMDLNVELWNNASYLYISLMVVWLYALSLDVSVDIYIQCGAARRRQCGRPTTGCCSLPLWFV